MSYEKWAIADEGLPHPAPMRYFIFHLKHKLKFKSEDKVLGNAIFEYLYKPRSYRKKYLSSKDKQIINNCIKIGELTYENDLLKNKLKNGKA